MLPSIDDTDGKSAENTINSMNIPLKTNSSKASEKSIDGRHQISMNDSVYGYKSIVLKKVTEEGLKELLDNGSKSKAIATVTYKVS